MSEPLGFLDRVTPSSPETPSELQLDRYAAGELTGDARAVVERWLATSPDARARLESRQRFPASVDRDALFARIDAGLPPVVAPARGRPARVDAREPWWRRLLSPAFLGSVVAVAAVALLVTRPWSTPNSEGDFGLDTIRAKGSFGFLVHRKTAAGSEALISGAEAREGDRLRFEVDLAEDGHLMIIDQDPHGALAVAWPLDGLDAARPVAAGPRALDGAVELDGAVGDEWLHAVVCPTPLRLADVAGATPGTLRVPTSCRAVPFLIRKVR